MPVLNFGVGEAAKGGEVERLERRSGSGGNSAPNLHLGLTGLCANPECGSGWLHLFRSRRHPVFEGGWTCSVSCTEERVRLSVRREMEGWSPVIEPYRPRIPLGLLMLEQGWISASQLRCALEAQKRTGEVRIGEWLVKQGATDQASVTRALSMQWGCPVLRFTQDRATAAAGLIPRLFIEAFKVLPIRTEDNRLLYLGFEERRDPVLALAVERMTGVRVESGIVPSSEYDSATRRVFSEPFPPVQFVEAVSEWAAAHALGRSLERNQPVESRLVRVRNWLWLRMYLKLEDPVVPRISSVRDVICTIEPLDSSNQHPGR